MKFNALSQMWGRTMSPPSRGAWIEMTRMRWAMRRSTVAPLAGGVD